MNIRTAETKDRPQLVELIAQFRQSLAQLQYKDSQLDLESAQKELVEFQEKTSPIFLAESRDGQLVGYLVCRVEDEVVWAESLFVLPAFRGRGIGSTLYARAEALAAELGSETLYNWVDPTNTAIIRFLGKHGYNVLNLIELRKPGPNESLTTKVRVGENAFDHY